MTSITNLSRSEAIKLRDGLNEILDNKELNQIKIVHSKEELYVTRSTDGLSPLEKQEDTTEMD